MAPQTGNTIGAFIEAASDITPRGHHSTHIPADFLG